MENTQSYYFKTRIFEASVEIEWLCLLWKFVLFSVLSCAWNNACLLSK